MPAPQPAALDQKPLAPAVETAILDAIRSLQYGSVIEVSIHDGRVVQVQCTSKIRFGTSEH